jgi:uncharacterized protein YndB with AHSA1/START domain
MADIWQGRSLTSAAELNWVHYRIHDAVTGELISFGSNAGETALEDTVSHFQSTREKHKGRRLVLRQYDGPAFFQED